MTQDQRPPLDGDSFSTAASSGSTMAEAAVTARAEGEDEGTLLDIAIVLAKHKRLVLGLPMLAAVLAAGITLLMPNIYTGTARILPPQQTQSQISMMLGQLTGLTAPMANIPGLKNPNELYVGMLKSRGVADNIISRFGLQGLYEEKTMVETRKKLADLSAISLGKDGLITIEYDDPDPKRAAAVANAYVEELDKLTQSLAVTEAGQRRLFFERELRQTKENLAAAELAMKQTMEKTGLIKLDDQGKAIIEAVASLRAQISAKEVELKSMRTFATDQNPEYIRAQHQLDGLRGELAKLERAKMAGEGDVLVPTGRVPEAGLEYLRSFRDVKYYEAVFDLLAKQFEAAKIDEAKDAAIIQVVDHAVPVDRKSKPKRALIVLLVGLITGAVATGLAFVKESLEAARSDPIKQSRLNTLRRYIRMR